MPPAYTPGPERGYTNLAVFLGACSFDCLFCQNRSYHQMARHLYPLHTPEELAAEVTDRDACLCFGGDPSPQMPFALKAARLARQRAGNRIDLPLTPREEAEACERAAREAATGLFPAFTTLKCCRGKSAANPTGRPRRLWLCGSEGSVVAITKKRLFAGLAVLVLVLLGGLVWQALFISRDVSLTYHKPYSELKDELLYARIIDMTNNAHETFRLIRDKEKLVEIVRGFDKLKAATSSEHSPSRDGKTYVITMWRQRSSVSSTTAPENDAFGYRSQGKMRVSPLRSVPWVEEFQITQLAEGQIGIL